MSKSLAGVTTRVGSVIKVGDNRYGMREAYDSAVDKATKDFYKKGDQITVREVKNKDTRAIKTYKP